MKYAFFFGCLLSVMAIAFTYPSRLVTGRVVDQSGMPLAGASVIVKGTGVGTVTNANGFFSVQVSNDAAVLVIGEVGFEAMEIKVGKQSKLVVRLQRNTQVLQEVVVVGRSGGLHKMTLMGAVVNAGYSYLQGSSVAGRQDAGTYHPGDFNYEGYDHITENSFLKVNDHPLSTFSIDVDAASYSNVRRLLNSGHLPPHGAVRIEEMINYFSYAYPQPADQKPFSVNTELAVCPWNTQHQLLLIGLQGKKMDVSKLPPSNLTFLIDVSGSMFEPHKLPLVKASLKLLVDQLRPMDKVAIVAYAGNAGLVLPATEGENRIKIKEAIDNLEAGGSTAGGAGIQLAYKIAGENFIKNGNNRVILCTDGDFNVGASSDDALERMIEEERKTGVYLTVLGFGAGNYQDAKMQKLADKGNGNHAYIDGIGEAKKVLINEFGGTLFTIAKDVKLQVEFNPEKVKAYRLIGYENRLLAAEDFNNDEKDAGDLGSGHTVTALYELVPPGVDLPETGKVDSLRYQTVVHANTSEQAKHDDELLNIKLRYKDPDGTVSKLLAHPVKGTPLSITNASDNFRFAAAVAAFGMLLRDSEFKGSSSFSTTKLLAEQSLGKDQEGYRKEFVQLVDIAGMLVPDGESAEK